MLKRLKYIFSEEFHVKKYNFSSGHILHKSLTECNFNNKSLLSIAPNILKGCFINTYPNIKNVNFTPSILMLLNEQNY